MLSRVKENGFDFPKSTYIVSEEGSPPTNLLQWLLIKNRFEYFSPVCSIYSGLTEDVESSSLRENRGYSLRQDLDLRFCQSFGFRMRYVWRIAIPKRCR